MPSYLWDGTGEYEAWLGMGVGALHSLVFSSGSVSCRSWAFQWFGITRRCGNNGNGVS